MNKNLKEIIRENNVLCIMKFGSHLYGMNTSESDTDYKGIYLPTKRQILLQQIPKSISFNSKNTKQEGIKNTKDDVDIELYSLNYFIELCLKGETVGIDMIHCPDEKLVYLSEVYGYIWKSLRINRKKLYTKNLKGFVGYCRKQAAKYGIKGSRISDARRVHEFLYKYNVNVDHVGILSDVWEDLPKGEHIHFVLAGKNNNEEFYQVCGKKMQKTAKITYCIEILKKFIDSYGQRALLAEKNEGIDWKAVSHAMRYGLQIKELFETGDIVFPLKDAEYLRDIKKGKLNYLSKVAPALEYLMTELEELTEKSSLPVKPDRQYFEDFLIAVYGLM